MTSIILEFIVLAFAVIFPATLVAIVANRANHAQLSPLAQCWAVGVFITLLGVWFAAAVLLAKADLFTLPTEAPQVPRLILLLLGGSITVWALANFTAAGRKILEATDQSIFMGVQILRVIGFVFLVGWAIGPVPWEFAMPAGLGDIATGILAVFAYKAVRSNAANARALMVRVHILGLLDFVAAIGTGVLTSNGYFHLLSTDAPNIIDNYPLVLVPAFFVPLFLTAHILSIQKMVAETRKAKTIPA
ncbi:MULTISPECIES: hypothetical protein [unclassified Pseudovibrio]|uniref:hypothetical protein n=1 Tax=unclassified Pseudovibrio TaxID=2627060 RepID=UPI0007AEAD55|nr:MULTISPECIES: hypothetical protein [unclassified Pseudovibrio]KZK97528.1 hypothetical protein PsW74_03662 [Pseudovibrio sp. W74]KZL04768.1 hypothetical protein PsAD14_05007 [Pseudovibrio sp. Ad14]